LPPGDNPVGHDDRPQHRPAPVASAGQYRGDDAHGDHPRQRRPGAQIYIYSLPIQAPPNDPPVITSQPGNRVASDGLYTGGQPEGFTVTERFKQAHFDSQTNLARLNGFRTD
jgi:hypothetical protein